MGNDVGRTVKKARHFLKEIGSIRGCENSVRAPGTSAVGFRRLTALPPVVHIEEGFTEVLTMLGT